MLLAIDTSAGTSAAVLADKVLSLVLFEDPFGHAENIGTAISTALTEAKVSASEITAVAIGRGPAPYTGLRVGMAAGIAFANALQIPIYGVMVLDAVAFSSSEKRLLLTADAKRRELFAAGYVDGVRNFGPEVITADRLVEFEDYAIQASNADAGMIGLFALDQLAKGVNLQELAALYLRSPDVSPSPGKKVTG